MNEKAQAFELSPPPCGLLSVQQAADTFGISRQAFHRWAARPERVLGRERLFSLAAIVDNRLEHAAADNPSPESGELDRMEARRELLSEQLEAQQLRNEGARAASIDRQLAEYILQQVMAAAAAHIEALPDQIVEAVPRAAPALDLIRTEAQAAAAHLRRASLPDPDPTTGQAQVYT